RRAALALMAIALVAVACTRTSTTTTSGPPPSPPAAVTGANGIDTLQHLIFIVQENRSFDQYFGTFPGADGIPRNPDGSFDVCVPDDLGVCYGPFHDHGVYDMGGPHDVNASVRDINGGRMDGFILSVAHRKACGSAANTSFVQAAKDVPRVGPPDVIGYH